MELVERSDRRDLAGRGTTAAAVVGDVLGGIGTFGTLAEVVKGWFVNNKPARDHHDCGNDALLATLIAQLASNGYGGGHQCCSENMPVNRYEQGLVVENSELRQQLALRDSQVYTDRKIADTVAFFNGKVEELQRATAEQAVKNAKIEGAFELVGERLNCVKNEFMAALCRERDERECADNKIVNYVNATFYPKLVAGVTPTTETTAQTVYNPLCACGSR